MSGQPRPSIRRVASLVALAMLAASTLAAVPAAAGTFAVRLEAGPQVGLRFDAAGAVTATRSLTFRSPVNATGTIRRWFAGRGQQLFLTSGPLAGWWVRESRVAHIRGYAGRTTSSPALEVRLPAGRYEVYRFDAAGRMGDARAVRYPSASTIRVDQRAVILGRPYLRVASGSLAGWWVPGTAAAPQRIACTPGPKPAPSGGRLVRSVPAATGRIALTFDMGGRTEPALDIVRLLVLERVCATIFPTGDTALTPDGRAVMALIAAHPELFELGNHTRHHCNLRDGGGGTSACPAARPSDGFVAQELAAADATFRELGGPASAPYWRPPYGAIDSRLVTAAARAGYPEAIMWTVDTIDWRPVADGGPTAGAMVVKVRDGATPGGIVLMHLGGYATLDALPGMLQALAGRGYAPASVSGLLAAGPG